MSVSAGAPLLPILSSRGEIRHVSPLRFLTALACLSSCTQTPEHVRVAAPDTVIVYSASSVAAPLRAVLEDAARRSNLVVQQENGASLELARRVTDLHRIPDVIVLADQEVFPQLLVPRTSSWYVRFARNRMVIAYTEKSRGANELSASTWRNVLQRPGVLVGRADPAQAPAGYRALLLYQLAEHFYHDPGLAARLDALTPPTQMRANATELAALLSAGALDYVIDYESLARANHFKYLTLPGEIDLGDPARSAEYAQATVRVPQRGDTITRRGAPILYGASVPREAPHVDAGTRVLAFMLGASGRSLLRARSVDALEAAEIVGDSAPAIIRRAVAP
jgi:molybdate/tungstate transport system substrate-binding protein